MISPPWSSSATVRTSRSTSRSRSLRSVCRWLGAADRPATRNGRMAHQMERAVVLLRRERDVAERLLVVSVWVAGQRDRPADRAPDEALVVPARKVPVHERAHRRDRLCTIGGERGDVFRRRLDVWRWLHGFVPAVGW